jgi:hypothetical protein
MIIFLDDDAACRAWLARRSHAAAVEGMRDGNRKRLLLHASGCNRLKHLLGRKMATTHGRWVACAMQREELTQWCLLKYGGEPQPCPACSIAAEACEDHHLTRLDRDILDFVLDVAVIHLEPDAKPYHLAVSDVAQCLRKTTRQLQAALDHLTKEGLITLGVAPVRGANAGERRTIYPTARALETLEYFAACDRGSVEAEIARLHAA